LSARTLPRIQKYLHTVRTVRRNRRDLGRWASHPAFLRDYDASGLQADALRRTHAEYITTVSSPVATLSLETALVTWFILNVTSPRTIVDLGSGFSSYLFRSFQQQRNRRSESCRVLSCDDDRLWLERTGEFLTRKHLPASGLYLWDDFQRMERDIRPDLVLYDLGNSAVRLKNLPVVLSYCRADTIVVIDDVHKPWIRNAVLEGVRSRGLRCCDLAPIALDAYGRYPWLVHTSECAFVAPQMTPALAG
jgi:hypothetical protein